MDSQLPTVDPLAAAACLADATDGRRRLAGRAAGLPWPNAFAAAVEDWQAAADEAELACPCWPMRSGHGCPQPSLATAAAPPLGRAA